MNIHLNQLADLTRRRLLGNVSTGLGGIGLMHLLTTASTAEQSRFQPGRGQTHHAAKAKRSMAILN